MSDWTRNPFAEQADHRKKPNGHDHGAGNDLRLVRFGDMQPQLQNGYLVKNLLSSAGMCVIYGEPGAGKTFLALWLGLCVASGRKFFGRRVRQGAVLYIAAEAGRSIENRTAAARKQFDLPDDTPFAAITSPVDLCSGAADVARLVALIHATDFGMPIALIIVDTLSRVMAGGNENAPDDMGALVRNCDKLRDETGAYLALVHHCGKDVARGARGHSLLRAATDAEIEVTRDEAAKLCIARVTKQRDFATDGSFVFRLLAIELGEDEDHDPVTSCVIEEADADVIPKAKLPKLPASQRRALELLTDAIARAGAIPPASNHIPGGLPCVSEDLWRRYCYEGGISDGEQEARKKAFHRSATELVAAGRVGKWGAWVWLV